MIAAIDARKSTDESDRSPEAARAPGPIHATPGAGGSPRGWGGTADEI
jgi:hypothetical protein